MARGPRLRRIGRTPSSTRPAGGNTSTGEACRVHSRQSKRKGRSCRQLTVRRSRRGRAIHPNPRAAFPECRGTDAFSKGTAGQEPTTQAVPRWSCPRGGLLVRNRGGLGHRFAHAIGSASRAHRGSRPDRQGDANPLDGDHIEVRSGGRRLGRSREDRTHPLPERDPRPRLRPQRPAARLPASKQDQRQRRPGPVRRAKKYSYPAYSHSNGPVRDGFYPVDLSSGFPNSSWGPYVQCRVEVIVYGVFSSSPLGTATTSVVPAQVLVRDRPQFLESGEHQMKTTVRST